jgi:hypothetical protein
VEGGGLVRTASRSPAETAEADLHAAPTAGLAVGHDEIAEGPSGIGIVHHAPNSPFAAGQQLDTLGGGRDAGLARPEPGLAKGLQVVGLAGHDSFDDEGAVGPGGLLRSRTAEGTHGRAAPARSGRPSVDALARHPVATLVAQVPGDGDPGPQHYLDRLG